MSKYSGLVHKYFNISKSKIFSNHPSLKVIVWVTSPPERNSCFSRPRPASSKLIDVFNRGVSTFINSGDGS